MLDIAGERFHQLRARRTKKIKKDLYLDFLKVVDSFDSFSTAAVSRFLFDRISRSLTSTCKYVSGLHNRVDSRIAKSQYQFIKTES